MRTCFVWLLTLSFAGAALADDKKPDPADFFTIEAPSGQCTVGQPCTVSVRAVGKNGYKWNKDYPAKITFEAAPTGVELTKSVLRQIPTKDNWADGVKVPLKVTQSGAHTLSAKMSLSVCRKDICRLFRKHPFQVTVKGK